MNHRPGTLIRHVVVGRGRPCTRRDSFGVRWIIRPPVSTGIASAKMPRGMSTAFSRSCTGRCHRAFDQSTSGSRGRQVEPLRRRHEVLARRVAREHRAYLVLLAGEPRDEEHLHRAAAVPVALLVVRLHAPDARAEALRVHRGVRGVPSAATPIWYSAVDEQPASPPCRSTTAARRSTPACPRRRSAARRGCRSCPRRRSAPARSGSRTRSRA